MTEYEERILEWIRELIKKEKPAEVISFYNGLPIRTRLKVLDVDEERKLIQWNSNPKLQLALQEEGKVFIPFYDKLYRQSRILESSAIYYGKDFLETTIPKPTLDGRFNREYVRVSVSDTLPLKVKLLKEGEELEVIPLDISEGGIGIFLPAPKLEPGEKIGLKILFPNSPHEYEVEGEVVRKEMTSKGERTGIKFVNPSKRFQNEVSRYIMARQREIMNQIRMLSE